MGIKTPSITNSRQSMPRNFPMNIDSLGMGEVSNPSNVLNSRSSRNNLFIPRVPEKINATQMIPGPTVAISCGDGSNVKLKINAITTIIIELIILLVISRLIKLIQNFFLNF